MKKDIQKQKLILLGAPGSGKGTQAKMLCEQYRIDHISTGDMLREAIKKGSELGKRAKGYMDQGKLVPDQVILGMIKERLMTLSVDKGVIFDGFPRTIPQAEGLDSLLGELGLGLDAVIYINVGLEEVVERMAGRLTCPACGRTYHKKYNPPVKDMVCDNEGVQLTVRSDDREEVVRERYRTFMEQTKPLVDYYDNKGVLVYINGEQAIDNIYNEIVQKL